VTSSGTGALHLGLAGLGVGMGDEVLVPEVSGVAVASAVRYTRATPVFVDVDPETWCLDPDSARRAVTSRTKAIVAVHLYGHPADMSAITRLARDFGLKVLEDAAPALGAEVGGRKAGGLGDLACFSFQGARTVTTGEGGMLTTSDEALFERVKLLGDLGRDPHRPAQVWAVGYKYKMSNLQAALGLAQLERVEEMVAKKRLIYRWYRERLRGVAGISLNVEREWARNVYWMTSVVLDGSAAVSREAVAAGLGRRQIGSRPFFPPLSSLPMFHSWADKNPVAYRVAGRGLNLPSGHNLTEEDVDRVCAALREVLAASCRRAA
jgi:perosamine synthetase